MKVKLDSPIVELPSILATKHGMVVKNGASSDDIRFRPNGTGAFSLKELKLGDLKTTFTRNDSYWREGLPKSACLTVTAITEPISRVAALKSGEADIVLVVDPATIGTLKEDPNITLTKSAGGSAITMGMFMDVKPFDDPRVRQAMKLVIDRQAIVDTALLGFGTPGNDNPILPNSPDAYRSDVMQRDVGKAKQLLAEAGHPDGFSVDLHAADLMPGTMAMVQAYQQMASEAGIKINIINEPAGEYWDTIWLKQPFAVSNWGMRTTPAALSVAYRKDSPVERDPFPPRRIRCPSRQGGDDARRRCPPQALPGSAAHDRRGGWRHHSDVRQHRRCDPQGLHGLHAGIGSQPSRFQRDRLRIAGPDLTIAGERGRSAPSSFPCLACP